MRCAIAATLLLLAQTAVGQVVQTYTANQTGSNLRSLGYAVPLPVESLTPVDGFRSYASLHARLQSLALSSADLSAHDIGRTFRNRELWAYVVSSPASTTVEGRAKPVFFINAATHAREWAVPEVSVGLIERMITATAEDGFVRYLLDNTRLVIVPVQNIDGLLQTQRFPTQVVVGQDPRFPNDWPRDGRMRRKNMRVVDEVLTSFGDHLLGTDLNRNHAPFWGTTTNGGQLTSPIDLTYRGTAVQVEPEVQAVLAAAELGPASRIRLGIDLHSHARTFFSGNTGRERLNSIQAQLISVLRNHHIQVPTSAGGINGRVYTDVPDPPNSGIGTASEFFAYQWLVPSWTLELEPGNGGGTEYGGNSVSHSGFILPNEQARRVREAWAETHLVAFYYMAGAPHLQRVELISPQSGEILQAREWRLDPGGVSRSLLSSVDGVVPPHQAVTVRLGFSKPMRLIVDGQASGLPGAPIGIQPSVAIRQSTSRTDVDVSAGRWIESAEYPGTSNEFEFTFNAPPAALASIAFPFAFEVATVDMVGLQLDANPMSPVDWSGGAWSGWNATADAGSEGDVGGADASMVFRTSDLPLGQMPRVDVAPPGVVGEGDVVRLRLVLDTPAEETISIHAEPPETTRIRPIISPEPPPVPIARWLPGESGVRELWLRMPDDVVADGERVLEYPIGVSSSAGVFEFARFEFRVLDNDLPGSAVVSLPFVDFGAATLGQQSLLQTVVSTNSNADTSLELVLHGDRDYPVPRQQNSLFPATVRGAVKLHGNATRIVIPSHTEATALFGVEQGGSLDLDLIRFESEGQPLPSGTAERMPIIADSAGSTRLSRAEVIGIRAGSRTLLGGSGDLRLERSSIRALSAVQPIDEASAFLLESSSLTSNVSGTHVVASRRTGDARWNSVIANIAGMERFGTTESSGRTRFEGNLLQKNASAPLTDPPRQDCGFGVESLGFNLYSGSHCPQFSAIGDQRGIVFADYPTPIPQQPDTGKRWLPPLGEAIDYGGNCGPVDQRGAPRPQTLDVDAEPLCDVGAVELGINPYRGIWQPARPGHGVDLQTSGNQLLLAWYTYDDDGQPTAYQAIAPLTGPRWRAELQRSSRNAENGAINPPLRVGEVGIDFVDDTHATLRWRFDARGVDGSEAITALVFAPEPPRVEVTGLWFPPAESGYGATITRRGEITAVGLYYYDASGALRWALGTGGGESVDDIAMLSYTGFCPDCDASTMPVQSQPAGRLLYHFLTPRRARIDTDLSYPGAAGGTWQRANADFVPLNDPVDNREALDPPSG